jgi:NhaC family Na+:H+ antiporter
MKTAILAAFIIVGNVTLAAVLGIPLFVGFGVALIAIFFLSIQKGHSFRSLLDASLEGLKRIKPVVWILLLIASLIPAWIASGTIPAMIELGIRWVHPSWLVFIAFVLSAIVSFLLGTSIGTLGSLGVVLIGVAISANVPIPLVAGALVSGAFFGDRLSPLSSMFHLVANSVSVEPRKLFHKMLPSTVIILVGCLLFYLLAGMFVVDSGSKNSAAGIPITALLHQHFDLNIYSFLPIIVLFGSILLKANTIRALFLGVGSGLLVAIFHEQVSLHVLSKSLVFGYHGQMEAAELAALLRGGGWLQMLELIVFIGLAGMMNGVLDRTQIFQPLIHSLFKQARSMTKYSFRTVFLAVLLALVGSNQAFPIMMTGRSLGETWKQAGFEKEDLGRVIGDSGLVVSGLIPWNMVAILSATAIGVPTLEYAAFAVLLWLSPVATVMTSMIISRQQAAKKAGLSAP